MTEELPPIKPKFLDIVENLYAGSLSRNAR